MPFLRRRVCAGSLFFPCSLINAPVPSHLRPGPAADLIFCAISDLQENHNTRFAADVIFLQRYLQKICACPAKVRGRRRKGAWSLKEAKRKRFRAKAQKRGAMARGVVEQAGDKGNRSNYGWRSRIVPNIRS